MVAEFESTPGPGAETLNLLLDMELPLSISLGRVRLSLGEVLDLDIGSSIELHRLAEEPADVVVNGRVVARGEVVVVDGNYGIRITEVASRAARLESTASARLTQNAAADVSPVSFSQPGNE